jgi:hypothetical protein
MGAALAAMMRNVKVVYQRVRRDRYTGGGWHKYTSDYIELLPMGNPLEDTGLLREGRLWSCSTCGTIRRRPWTPNRKGEKP